MATNHPVVNERVLQVCKHLNSLPTKITPKVFIWRFLQSGHSNLPLLRRHWAGDKGINTTMELVETLRSVINKTGAIKILIKQEPPRGNYPQGGFHSSSTVGEYFFTPEAKEEHERRLTEEHMPFLFGMLMGMLNRDGCKTTVAEEEDVPLPCGVSATKDGPDKVGDMFYEVEPSSEAQSHQRLHRVRISEQVQEYLNYIGLSSARTTGMAALETLAYKSADTLKMIMDTHKNLPMAPLICIDNIDIEQRVHQSSVGVRSNMLQGTWGHIHIPDKKLIQTLDLSEINLLAYTKALKTVASMEIEPCMFVPTESEEEIELKVWKSQIAKVLYEYIAIPNHKSTAVQMVPPVKEWGRYFGSLLNRAA
ncbi:uncharacterized protein PGTG_22611 [Puccinia graminis f. sp. tritici CRL 75-36-700-3]|uniref:Uncharacterized protein n=1 Tax=Puccinia graminis f. sp. tritici (strain CRL 75-36-700-3 / race SCCL) TaxID=418459 RepID=H6QV47_PUCGT|nr:uncharacterized protein PGTG_22611 [Puccinia graminis f. sp. tritici CRL 75-36-700-3]EHS62708.1 hypothetical protein PGTG_22611 [Puccinia graminis f. sp. tritici CRL 75-36-700-3]